MGDMLNPDQREHMNSLDNLPRKELCPCGWNSEKDCLSHCSTGARTNAPRLVHRIQEIYGQIDGSDLVTAPEMSVAGSNITNALFEAHAQLTFNYQSYMNPPSETDGRYEGSMRVWNLEPKVREMMSLVEIDLFDALMKLKPNTPLEGSVDQGPDRSSAAVNGQSPDRRVSVAEVAKVERLGKLIHKIGLDMDALLTLAGGAGE